jgi:hypothetical protein
VRELLKAAVKVNDNKTIDRWPLTGSEQAAVNRILPFCKNTDIETLLTETGVIRPGYITKENPLPKMEEMKKKAAETGETVKKVASNAAVKAAAAGAAGLALGRKVIHTIRKH